MSLTTSTPTSSLKNQLDEIDKRVVSEVFNGFYESRLKIELAIWEKGRTVVGFRGVNPTVTWVQISTLTRRTREDLKRWSDLFERYRDRDKFLKEYAEPKAKAWTEKALNGPRRTLLEDRSEEVSYSNLTLQELVNVKIEPESTPEKLLALAIAELPREQQDAYKEYRATKDQLLDIGRKIMKIVGVSTDIREVIQCRDILLSIAQTFAEDLLFWEAKLGELQLQGEAKP